ncbi:hypothetical protein JVW21_21400, partial [Vibrio cholerae O1]|nr:hypothetical protein [Vibrio cholerae O1]
MLYISCNPETLCKN